MDSCTHIQAHLWVIGQGCELGCDGVPVVVGAQAAVACGQLPVVGKHKIVHGQDAGIQQPVCVGSVHQCGKQSGAGRALQIRLE